MVSKVINTSNHSKYGCCYTKMNDDDRNCCDCQSAFTSSKDVIKTELFDIGETLFFTNDGWSGLVKVKSLYFDESNVLRIVVSNSNGKDIITTKEHLRSPSNPDVGWIPSSVPEYRQASKTLSEEDVEKLHLQSICHLCSKTF